MRQEDIWIEHTKSLTPQDVINDYNNPAVFQSELSNIINKYIDNGSDIIEVGCETGITSFLLDDKFRRTLLDLNPYAIDLAKNTASLLNKEANFIVGNMFNIDLDGNSFDLVFNAGVIEHFDKEERIAALTEYARLLRENGKIIIGFPNHYCIPYRFAYILLKSIKHWPYPSEYKIYDLADEISAANLVLENRFTLSRKTIFNWLNFALPIKFIFKLIDKICNYEGYLTVVVISKKQ